MIAFFNHVYFCTMTICNEEFIEKLLTKVLNAENKNYILDTHFRKFLIYFLFMKSQQV